MPAPDTLRLLDAFWAASFGCSVADLHADRVTVVAHTAQYTGYAGVYMLRYGAASVVTVPPRCLSVVIDAVRDKTPDEVFDSVFLISTFGNTIERLVGPSYRGCADASDFRPVDPRGTRPLGPEDSPALKRLAAACGPEAWSHSSIAFDRPPVFGRFVGHELAAAGSLYSASDRLRNVGILTHPAFRGQGYGRAVVSAMCAHALASGEVPQYQTLLSNLPSLAIARALGFSQYATGLAARLRLSPGSDEDDSTV